MNEKPIPYDYIPVNTGYPGFIRVFSKEDEDVPVGWIFVVGSDDGGCIIMDMFVDPEYRRKGYGKVLIQVLQERYNRAWTGISTVAGRGLCLSMGFKLIMPTFKKQFPRLEWKAPKKAEGPEGIGDKTEERHVVPDKDGRVYFK